MPRFCHDIRNLLALLAALVLAMAFWEGLNNPIVRGVAIVIGHGLDGFR